LKPFPCVAVTVLSSRAPRGIYPTYNSQGRIFCRGLGIRRWDLSRPSPCDSFPRCKPSRIPLR